MAPAIVRVLAYLVLGYGCYAVAVFFVPEGPWFAAVFGAGLLIAVTAELLLWRHLLLRTIRR